MRVLESELYQSDLAAVTSMNLPWDMLRGGCFLISGATGMIGSTLIDVLMKRNREQDLGCRIIALGRSEDKARARFDEYLSDERFSFVLRAVSSSITVRKISARASLS